MNSSWFFRVLVAFSSSVHGFLVVHPMFTKFESLRNYDLHQDWKLSSRIIHMHTQAFRKISQLVNFELFPCDLSPPLKLTVGGFLKDRKMSYTHPNLISSVAMGFRRQGEEMRKYPFWDFLANWLWPFNFQPNIFKFEYLSFCSFDWKTEDSSGNLEIERRHGEKPIFIFWVINLRKSLWLFNFP